MKKIFAIICCLCLLCGCSVKVDTDEDYTTSNQNQANADTTATTTPSVTQLGEFADYSTSKVIWGPGNITDHQQPADPLSLGETFGSLGGKWLLDDEKCICLTFDEGYENGYTPSILDTLKEKNVKAVFFVTYDFAKDNPDLIDRMISEGHIVGNHTYRHYTMDEIDINTATEEVMLLHQYMIDNHNYTMSYFRFPKGEFSQQSLALVQSLGYESLFWSFAYADWDANNPSDPQQALEHICNSTHDGAIILLHAVSPTNAEILPQVIDNIKSQGYTFTVEA